MRTQRHKHIQDFTHHLDTRYGRKPYSTIIQGQSVCEGACYITLDFNHFLEKVYYGLFHNAIDLPLIKPKITRSFVLQSGV